jgi:hypothetical protein
MNAETIGVGIAAISAAASAVSAHASRTAVDRSHRAFVWPVISHTTDPEGRRVLRLRLHNDGPGAGYDVRWAVGSVTAGEHDNVVDDLRLTADTVSDVIRALRPEEVLPPSDWFEKAIALPDDDIWWVLVRWTDASGARRDLSEQGPRVLADLPRETGRDLAMARDGGRPLSVEAPEAVVATFAQQRGAVRAQVSLKVAALHAAMTSSSGSLSAAAPPLG